MRVKTFPYTRNLGQNLVAIFQFPVSYNCQSVCTLPQELVKLNTLVYKVDGLPLCDAINFREQKTNSKILANGRYLPI